jgi:hypothetical protein
MDKLDDILDDARENKENLNTIISPLEAAYSILRTYYSKTGGEAYAVTTSN